MSQSGIGERHKQWQKRVRSSFCLFNDSRYERKGERVKEKTAQDIEENRVNKMIKILEGNAAGLNRFSLNCAKNSEDFLGKS